ncbi:ABC-F family ATP-binding cassette domain-containing protein [Candidatus Uhrbacteria bacterium]|nr:ABC-F family ATP-binding cassette domain-containing protein [Candidatus Uhrbacteria bacterium]
MISVKGLYKTYGTATVLAGVDFIIGNGQRAAIVGYNGTGKTTILKILAGLEEVDAGKIEFAPGARIGYLPQDTSLVGTQSILGYLKEVSGLAAAEATMAECVVKLDQPEARCHYEAAQDLFDHMNGYEFDYRVEVMLAGFGLEQLGMGTSLSELSSGQKSKVALIAMLLRQDNVLLLDEPTNNLDLPALIWLEDYLKKSDATVLVVSHDRRFIDRIADKVIELDWRLRTTTTTHGTYTDYLTMCARRREQQRLDYIIQQAEIDRLSESAESLRRRASAGAGYVGTDNDKFQRGFKRDKAAGSARGAKAIEQRLEQMDRSEKPFERVPLNIHLHREMGEGGREIRLVDVVSGYSDAFTVGPISLTIPFGQRVGILGMNGSGKSTLLKTITCQLASLSGRVELGSGLRIGNMMQEHDSLPRDLSPLDVLARETDLDLSERYALVAQFGMDPTRAKELVATLSPGARARLLLAIFAARRVNALVLDEPTNHLDLEAMEALEEALENFCGTLIIVSHDRYFMEHARLDQISIVGEGTVTPIADFAHYLEQAEVRAKRLLRSL